MIYLGVVSLGMVLGNGSGNGVSGNGLWGSWSLEMVSLGMVSLNGPFSRVGLLVVPGFFRLAEF